MESLLPLLQTFAIVAAVGGGFWWRDRTWRRLGQRFGLDYEAERPWGPRRLHGDINGISVELATLHTPGRNGQPAALGRRTQCQAGRGAVPEGLGASKANRIRNVFTTLMGTRQKVGDPAFDAKLQLTGDAMMMAAAMTEVGRRQLLELADNHDGFIEQGVVHASRRGWFGAEKTLSRLVERTLNTAAELATKPDQYPARLRHNALSDSVAEVKRRCARQLLEHYPTTEEANDVAQARRHDADSELAMLAALVMRDVPAILEMVHDPHVPVPTKALAIERLAGVDRETGANLAVEFLSHKRKELRLAACRAAEHHGIANILPIALDRIEKTSAQERAAIGRAALKAQGPIAAACAAWCLEHLEEEDLERARTLIGRDGDVRAVGALAPQAKGPLRSGALKRTARDLLNQLQERLHLSDIPGGLSLVDTRVGDLSLSPATSDGALSVAKSPTEAEETS